jgi:SAM-dependent methyltransferase
MQRNEAVPQPCLICGSESLRRIIGYEALPRVSSDSKPWPPGGTLVVCASCGTKQKIPDNAFKKEISKIYDGYEIYHQSEGAEQPIFDLASGTAAPRSKKLMASLTEMLSLPQTGRILDFGCGTGVALRNFAKLRPEWELSGAELSASSLPFLRQISGFKTLYTCEATEIPETFDVITLIHSLEHVLEPVRTLSSLRDRLNPGGHLFVQVPDCGRTPYDLVIADHLLHFTLETLRFAGEQAGFRTVLASDSLLIKELSWLGVDDGAIPAAHVDPASEVRLAQQHVDWLTEQIAMAQELTRTRTQFGIFGTSISGTWLYGVVGDAISFFVDEDPQRIGRNHMGLPILRPSDIPEGAHVFVPLIPEVASTIARRLTQPNVRFHTPPRIGATTRAFSPTVM